MRLRTFLVDTADPRRAQHVLVDVPGVLGVAQVGNTLRLVSQLFTLVGSELVKMGHKALSSDGSPVGGFEGIMYTPDPNAPPGCAPADLGCTAPINGFYRAGSNFREDGHAAGYEWWLDRI